MEKQYDIRQDEEQEKKSQEVLELLVTAGYFRARIKGLSNFDKVVGGLVWCIEVCNVDIDIDLLFQEDLSIGKKISLTEKIVAVVNQMECPFKIEPHQIQGLDYLHIFPVIKWLVKKAIETRQAEGDEVRAFAVNQYHKKHGQIEVPEPEIDLNGIKHVQDRCKPKRIYRRKDQETETEKVDQTLLEYGQRKARSDKTSSDNHTDDQMKEITSSEEAEKTRQITADAVKGILNVDMLTAASEKYLQLKEDSVLINNPGAIQKAIDIIEEQKAAVLTRLHAVQEEKKALTPELNLAQERSDKIATELNVVDNEIAELELSAEKEELLTKLQKLVTKNELLKQKETEYKDQCRKEMEEMLKENEKLEQELKALKGEKVTLVDNEDTAEELAMLEKLRKKLTNVSKQVLNIERQLDAIPSRYELSQYQKRFVELDNQVAAEYCETQKFIIMYNTLRDQLMFMEKEVKLLNSIYDGIPDAKMSSMGAKEQFKNELEQIHSSVHHSKSKIEKSLREQQETHDSANRELNQLMEQQRTYSVLVRDMTEEMRRNEILSNDHS